MSVVTFNSELRALIREAGVTRSNISLQAKSGEDFALSLDFKGLEEAIRGLIARVPPAHRVSNFADLINLCGSPIFNKVEFLLRSHDTSLEEPLLILTTAMLLENHFLKSKSVTMGDALADWIDRGCEDGRLDELTPDALKDIVGAVRSRNPREGLNVLAGEIFGVNGLTLIEELGLTFANSFAEPTPQIVQQYQSKTKPLQFWFDADSDGPLMYIIYYSGKCSFLQCYGCALPSLSSQSRVFSHSIFEQTDYLIADMLHSKEREDMRTIVVSNNGSMFDTNAFSSIALQHATSKYLAAFPSLSRISFESRFEYLTDEKLTALNTIKQEYGSNVRFEIALGVEIFDERKRNKITRKGLTNKALELCIQLLSKHDFDLRCYFMLKPHPSMTEDDAYADISAALDKLDEWSAESTIGISMHLNPTYVAMGTALEKAFHDGQYMPPSLGRLADFVAKNNQRKTHIHLGLNDEGLAVKGGSFLDYGELDALQALRRHNMVGRKAAI